jgi:hypothetical protein
MLARCIILITLIIIVIHSNNNIVIIFHSPDSSVVMVSAAVLKRRGSGNQSGVTWVLVGDRGLGRRVTNNSPSVGVNPPKAPNRVVTYCYLPRL